MGRGGRLFERTGILLGVGETPRRRGSFLVWKVAMMATTEMEKKARSGIKGQPVWGIGAVLTSQILPPSLKSTRPEDPAPARPALLGATSRHSEPTFRPRTPSCLCSLRTFKIPVPHLPRNPSGSPPLRFFLTWLLGQLLHQFVKYAKLLIGWSAVRRVTLELSRPIRRLRGRGQNRTGYRTTF